MHVVVTKIVISCRSGLVGDAPVACGQGTAEPEDIVLSVRRTLIVVGKL